MGGRVQIGAVHRVHIVVDQEPVGAAPFGVTEDRLIGVARQPLGRGEGGRRGVRIGAVPREDRAAMLESRVAAHRALADQVAARLARHRRHRAVAEDLRAVIDADQAVAVVAGQRKPRAAVRAAVVHQMDCAVPVAPGGQVATPACERNRAIADPVRRTDAVPAIIQAGRQNRLRRIAGPRSRSRFVHRAAAGLSRHPAPDEPEPDEPEPAVSPSRCMAGGKLSAVQASPSGVCRPASFRAATKAGNS